MITYNTENVSLPSLPWERITPWIHQVATAYGRRIGDVNYIFVDDERILALNREFIGHDYYTDHIGFDYSEGSLLSGDIYISLDTVRTNAVKFGATYAHELQRVIIHGILHLIGLKDKEPAERIEMERAEDEALALW